MPIKKTSTRREDRQRIKELAQAGYSPDEISNAVSVKVETVLHITSGKFDDEEAAHKAAQRQRDLEAKDAELRMREESEARIAAAAAAAVAAASKGGEQAGASSQAKALADEYGIDLSTVEGTGKDGQITKGDVQAAIDAVSQGGGDD